MTALTIQVQLYPHSGQLLKDFSQYAWHRPALIQVQLTGKNTYTLVTGPGGVATAAVAANDTYAVSLGLPGFEGSTPASSASKIGLLQHELHVGTGQQTSVIQVYPAQDWLLPFQVATGPAAARQGVGLGGITLNLTDASGQASRFTSLADGSIYAIGPVGDVQVEPRAAGAVRPVIQEFVVSS